MLTLLSDLPWQLQVLVVETVVSALIGLALTYRGFQRTLGTMTLFLVWNLVLFALLITGGSVSWQHLTLGGLYLLDTATVVAAGVMRKKTEPETGMGVAVFATLWIASILYLIVGGS